MALRPARVAALLCLVAACGRPDVDLPDIVTSVGGRVLDAATSQPLSDPPFPLVSTEPFIKQEAVSADGKYVITGLAPGTSYRVTATRAGYLSSSVTLASAVEGTNTVSDILLTRAGPILRLSATSVTVQKAESAGTFRIENVGVQSESLTYEVVSSAEWITTIQNGTGGVTSTPAIVRVEIDRAKLPASGDVTTELQVTTSGGSGAVQLKVLR